MRLLDLWLIEEEYSTLSDHDLIVFKWLDLNLIKSLQLKNNWLKY